MALCASAAGVERLPGGGGVDGTKSIEVETGSWLRIRFTAALERPA